VPLAVIAREGSKRIVVGVDAVAHTRGVSVGMAVSMANALVPELVTRDADFAADAAALERLAIWALRRYSPIVAVDPPAGLMIDISGAAHLVGGEEPWLADITGRLGAVGISARVAIAATYGAAHPLARRVANPTLVLDADNAIPLLRSLPVSALRLGPAIIDGLRRLGFDRVGELADTPRAPLALRFGSDIGRRLDQMFGDASEPFELVSSPELIHVSRAFAEPIAAAETIARYISQLVTQLCEKLDAKALGARKLDLLFFRVDSDVQAVRVGTAKPVRDAKRLTRLLCDRIETVSPGFGIERVVLAAPTTERLSYKVGASNLVEAPVADVSDLVDLLANRIGNGRLYRFASVQSDIPERSLRRVAAMAPPTSASWSDAWPRPSRLFDPPESIETVALLPDHPPAAFTWRGVRRRIRRADGPERLFGEWWTRDAETASVRDYFQVEDDAGERFWLFRAGDGENPATGSQRWYVHGIFA